MLCHLFHPRLTYGAQTLVSEAEYCLRWLPGTSVQTGLRQSAESGDWKLKQSRWQRIFPSSKEQRNKCITLKLSETTLCLVWTKITVQVRLWNKGMQDQNWRVTAYCGSNSKVCWRVELRIVHRRAGLPDSGLFQELAAGDAGVAGGIFKYADHVIGREVGNHKASSVIIRILGDLERHQHAKVWTRRETNVQLLVW